MKWKIERLVKRIREQNEDRIPQYKSLLRRGTLDRLVLFFSIKLLGNWENTLTKIFTYEDYKDKDILGKYTEIERITIAQDDSKRVSIMVFMIRSIETVYYLSYEEKEETEI